MTVNDTNFVITRYGKIEVRAFDLGQDRHVDMVYATGHDLSKEEIRADLTAYTVPILAKIRQFIAADDNVLDRLQIIGRYGFFYGLTAK